MYRYSEGGEDGEGTRSPPPADVGSRERRAYATVYSHSSSFLFDFFHSFIHMHSLHACSLSRRADRVPPRLRPACPPYRAVIHGRWAMLGVAGLVAPEILGGAGLIPESTGLVWFKSGAIPPQGTFDYWADPVTIFWVNMVLMNFAEVKRGQDYWNPGSQAETPLMGWESGFAGSGNPAYPGGKFFNFAGLGKDDMATMQKKEIKNGRLAMMAFLGCMVQAAVTGEGPWKNICDHVAAPFSANMLTYFGTGSGASPF